MYPAAKLTESLVWNFFPIKSVLHTMRFFLFLRESYIKREHTWPKSNRALPSRITPLVPGSPLPIREEEVSLHTALRSTTHRHQLPPLPVGNGEVASTTPFSWTKVEGRRRRRRRVTTSLEGVTEQSGGKPSGNGTKQPTLFK